MLIRRGWHALASALRAGLTAALVTALVASAATAQRPGRNGDVILDAGGAEGMTDFNVTAARRNAGFRLFSLADGAGAGMHGTGNFSYAVDNFGPCDAPLTGFCGWNVHPARNPGAATFHFFEVLYFAGAPPSQRAKIAAVAPSVLNSTGNGWTTLMNFALFAGRSEWGPRDATLSKLFAGVTSTEDGSCRDHTGFSNGFYPTGLPLLASSNCPETWPDGVWKGDRLVEQSGWEQYRTDAGAAFAFDYWRVPDAYKKQDREFLGNNFSSYGESSDHYEEILSAYGSVIPTGSGAPGFQGYPLGLVWHFETFNFGLPALSGVTFYRATVINRSEEVYGVGVDYDSLYLGFAPGTGGAGAGGGQAFSDYYVPEISTAFYHQSGSSGPVDFCAQSSRIPAGVSGCGGGAGNPNGGYQNGGSAIIVLKSPIGDVRNKLFTRDLVGDPCTPGAGFCDPAHPMAGDTITFNHGHMCGFGGCWANTHNANDRRSFGLISSTEVNALDGRDPATFSTTEAWRTYRNFGYPSVRGVFNRYVPGSWDWNKDGIQDTLFFDSCHTNGCVTTDADTMPGGQINAYGNVGGVLAAGPVSLGAGDTTSWYVALVGEIDSASTYRAINAAISAYLTFYLLPEAPPPVNITSTQVTPAAEFDLRGDADVTLFFTDAPERWVDPFLASQAAVQPDPELAALLDARSVDNLEQLEIYKSCDGGDTFTSDADCDPDQASDAAGNPVGFGWEAYAVLNRDALGGDIPNAFTDGSVIGGKTYLYVIVGRSRGATFLISDPGGTSSIGDSLSFAPPISNVLSRSTSDPNVISVYVPASRQAGAQTARATFNQAGQDASVPFELTFADNVVPGNYRALFGNRIIVERDSSISGASFIQTRVTVQHQVTADVAGVATPTVIRSDALVRTAPEDFPISGAFAEATATIGDTVRTTRTINALSFAVVAGTNPFFASGNLTGPAATPTSAFALADFPGFTVSANNTLAGTFNSDEIALRGEETKARLRTEEDTVPRARVNASYVQWREQNSTTTAVGRGRYRLTWTDDPFGLPNGIVANFQNPGAAEAEFQAALLARADGSTGLTDTVTANRTGVTQADLVAVRAPFTVVNETFNRPVSIAMAARVSNRFLLGTGTDTVRVGIQPDQWVPGDALLFLEDVVEDSTTAAGVVLGGNGLPLQVTHRLVTFTAATLGCDNPRTACNPIAVGARGQSGHVAHANGDQIVFEYFSGFRPTTVYDFDLVAPTSGTQITAITDSMLTAIRVVPNPYVVFSQYQDNATDGRLLFTNLPPRGAIRIYTVSGQFVQQITWTEDDLAGAGDLFYDLKSREGIDIASGLYLWVVTAPSNPTDPNSAPVRARGKFVVIRGRAR